MTAEIRACTNDFFKTFSVADTGPIPIILGLTPELAALTILAIGFKSFFFIPSSLAIIKAAAPSLTPLEFPAVIEPPLLKGVGKFESFSLENLGTC